MRSSLTLSKKKNILIPEDTNLNGEKSSCKLTRTRRSNVLKVEVSCFRSYLDTTPKTVPLLDWLISDRYAHKVIALRSISDKAKRDRIKASLPAMTVSGIFAPTRKEENLVQHSVHKK